MIFPFIGRCVAGFAKLAIAILMLGIVPSLAQEYPRQPIKIVVPFPPGGGVDVVARIIAPKLSEALGQSIVVENRPGAGGMLGATSVAQTQPDGYTLLLGSGSTHGSNSVVYSRLGYDPVRDFTPIVLIASSPFLMVASRDLPTENVKDFITYAQARKGQLNFGSFGNGSNSHLAAELFNSLAKIEANHIPYRGSAAVLNDLIGGRIQYTFDGVQTSLGFIQAGTIRLLAVAGPERSPLLPNVPTLMESGIPFEATMWSGLFAPVGTPQAIVDLVNAKTSAILKDAGVQALFAKLGIDAMGGAPSVLASKVQTEMRKWVDIAREKNIRVDQ